MKMIRRFICRVCGKRRSNVILRPNAQHDRECPGCKKVGCFKSKYCAKLCFEKNGNTGAFKKGLVPWSKDKIFDAEYRRKISIGHITNGNTRPGKKVRNSAEYSRWRKIVFERDRYQCRSCMKVGGKLRAHHVCGFTKFPRFRFEPDNGITLCNDCHVGFHKRFGRINFRPEQIILILPWKEELARASLIGSKKQLATKG